MKKVFIIAVVFGALAFVYSCSKSSASTDDNSPAFDKTAMLTNYADNLIVPAYAALIQKITALETAANNFLIAPSDATQSSVKAAYEAAYQQYERVSVFQFGPAETALLDNFINFSGGLDYSFSTAGDLAGFSVDSVTIESNIASGTYNLGSTIRQSLYSQGFPALNYLFFGPNASAKFATNTAKRVQYVKDVIARIKSLVDQVASGWSSYRAEFIANTKTNVGSPIGNMVNQLAYQMDLLKGPRIGWPFGKQSNGIVFASKCEAYFSGSSLALAIENITALKNTYTGGNGKGLDDYVIALNHAALNSDVLAQFDITIAKLQAISNPLSAAFTNNAPAVDAAYKEIQKLLTLLKTDVASATAVQITFVDNDGD